MSDPPPPSDPPPGWYPDPAKEPGYRWWDGQAWTETITDDVNSVTFMVPGPSTTGSRLGPVGKWFSETFRLMVQRSGHFLPMIVIFVLTVSIPTSFAAWYALRDTVLNIDPDTAAVDIDYGGSGNWLAVVIVLFPISTVLSYLMKASVSRQAWAAQIEQAEPWSESVLVAVRRSGRVIAASLGRSLLYWGLGGLFILAVALSPAFVLLLPVLLAAFFLFWVRFSFVGTVAVLGGSDDRPFATSWRLSRGLFFPLSGRLLLMAFVAINLVLAAGIMGAPFTAIAGGTGTTAQTNSETLRFNDVLGATSAVFALGSVFNAIGLGVNYIFSAVGTTLLYRNLGGPVTDRTENAGVGASIVGGSVGG